MALSSTIPAVVLEKLIPIVQAQLSQLTNIGSYLQNALNSLPGNIKCSDSRINDIKQQLKNINDLIQNIKTLQPILVKVNTAFGTIQTTADAVKLIQLLIPAVLGVPQVPLALLANTVDLLGKNCQSASAVLANVSNTMNSAISKIESVIALAIVKLSSVCVNETFDVSKSVSNKINKKLRSVTSGTNSATVNKPDTNIEPDTSIEGIPITTDNSVKYGDGTETGSYTSLFYTDNNVAQADIDILESIIIELTNLKKSLTENINEAPSNVIISDNPINGDIGNLGDFYMDTLTKQLYGPKVEIDNWPTPIKY